MDCKRCYSRMEKEALVVSKEEDCSLLVHYITKEYELLKCVLGHLPLKDLNSAAQVCRSWESTADIIKRSRVTPHWFLWYQHQNGHRMEEYPSKAFRNYVYSEPQLCLCFISPYTNRYNIDCSEAKAPCPCGHRKKCKLAHRVVHYIRAQLLPECTCVTVEGCGVVGTTHDLSLTQEIERKRSGYSCLFLPKMPGTVVTYFQIDRTACTSLFSRNVDIETVEKMTGVPPSSQPIRCLLLFCREGQKRAITNLVKCLQCRQQEKIVVGGGLFNSINLSNVPNEVYKRRLVSIAGIALSGENVTAASTILGSHITFPEQVDEVMDELRSCNLPTKNTVAFMFACVGRGSQWYQQDNVESESFTKHFPSTPLMGYFGNGEIGLKHLPKPQDGGDSEIPTKRARDDKGVLFHSYTTVIVHVGFGSKASS